MEATEGIAVNDKIGENGAASVPLFEPIMITRPGSSGTKTEANVDVEVDNKIGEGAGTGMPSTEPVSGSHVEPHSEAEPELPPTYDLYYEIERNYPQHNASLPFPEGKDGRFLWVSNQPTGQHAHAGL